MPKTEPDYIKILKEVPSTAILSVLLERCRLFDEQQRATITRTRDEPPGLDANTVADLHLSLAMVALGELNLHCRQSRKPIKNLHLG
jgi:hypothetical protein